MQMFLAFVVALLTTATLVPLLARWAPFMGLTDRPGPRKVHCTPVPRIGGVAMAVGILAAILISVQLTPAVAGLLLGLAVLLVFGIYDDRMALGYRAKFAGQILAVALCMIVGRVHIDVLTVGTLGPLPAIVSLPLTFVFLIGVTNAVNLSDGLDGLAGGLVLLCLCGIALLAAASTNMAVTTLALSEAGAVLGFLRFNTHPARVFMGDAGSQVLGFTAGVLAILATQGESSAVSAALPLLLLALPIVDTLTVMLIRLRAGRSPFSADSSHLHHRLLGLGFTHREAVILIYVMQIALLLCAYFLRFESDLDIILVFCGCGALLLGTLHLAASSGWRVPQALSIDVFAKVAHFAGSLLPAARLPTLVLGILSTGLAAYIVIVIAASKRVGGDVAVLSLIMLVVLAFLSSWRAERSLRWFERPAAYISIVVLVYLDETTPAKSALLTALSWVLIAIIGAAAVLRLWISPTRRFEANSLDVLVVFIALVMPHLTRSTSLPSDLPAGIAKAIVLLYVVEMMLAIDLKRLMPRAFLALTLAVIAARGLLATST